jgi:prepilin-type N-terminal cleavage/methylation domain-containing protein
MNRKQNSRKRLDNAGMTLVELIIVVAIMAAVVGAMVMSTGFIGKSRLTKAYNKLQSDYSTARSDTMSKAKEMPLTISYKNAAYYIQVGSEQEEKLLSGAGRIYYVTGSADGTNASAKKELTGTLVLHFNRATGALKKLDDNDPYSYVLELYVNDQALYITVETGKYSTTKK